MTNHASDYLIVGAGLAGASAVEGIRERDTRGSIAIIGAENQLPYNRPPLSKKLWDGKKEVKDIFIHERAYYERNGVTLFAGRSVVALDVKDKTVGDSQGESHRFKKLLLATGGTPTRLTLPGADLAGICYYRALADFERMKSEAAPGKSVVIIGGGFIGSEMAAALCVAKLNVTMVYPSKQLCGRVFPEELGTAMERLYQSRGIRILKGQKPMSFERKGARFTTRTSGGEKVESDLVIVGIGIKPAVELANRAGLATGDGIILNEHLQTAHPDIYAAGDNARFPSQALGQSTRMEHWDNALNQGKHAGRNMAGAHEPFTYMPYFFSDLFEFGYEAVGEVNARMETLADWQKPFDTGVIYYLRNGKIRGVMMCNVWDKVEVARLLISRGAGADERLS